jgi:methionyl-tRNA formyltransferase
VQTVFLGTSGFAAAVLERLASSPHRPALIVTRPDRPRGRGRKLSSPPVADAARELGIELSQPTSVNDEQARSEIAASRPEAVCVCAFGALIKEPLLSDHLMLNVHPSLLPRWRGAAPIERAIMAGDERTGVTIMRVSAGLDSGPVYLREAEAIEDRDTYGTLAERLERLGGDLLVRALDELPDPEPQDDADATYAEKITAADRRLDPALTAVELERAVRALTPHIGAQIEVGEGAPLGLAPGTTLGVREAQALEFGPAAGTLSLDGGRLVLGCARGALELLTVHPPGRRPMRGEDFVRGLRR